MPVGVMFPGQGAQRPGLGEDFRDDEAWSVVTRAEHALGRDLSALLLDPEANLDRTEDAQLAVLLASLMAWERVRPDLGDPVALAGHSLGQVTALMAAGVLAFDDGIRLAARRARHTQRAADRREGRMVALLGARPEQAEQVCAAAPGACWVANDNAPGQIVIGGTPEGVDTASARAKELGVKRVMPLNVGGAFHTPLMQPAADAFASDLASAPFADTAVPVMSNHDALPHADGAGWPERLSEQLIRPVRWAETMPALVDLGATTFLEVGPGTTLTGLAKRAHPDITLRNIATPADLPLENTHA